jgi:hypothetical protein
MSEINELQNLDDENEQDGVTADSPNFVPSKSTASVVC